MASTRLECRILALGLGSVLLAVAVLLPVLVRGSKGPSPVVAAWALLSGICLLCGMAVLVAALLPIERHRTDHVIEGLFFRSVALVMVILGVFFPICEVARIPSFIDAALQAYRDYRQDPQPAKKEDIKERFLHDFTARTIRIAFVVFLPLGGLLLLASYGSFREREFG